MKTNETKNHTCTDVLCDITAEIGVNGNGVRDSAVIAIHSREKSQIGCYARDALRGGRRHVAVLTALLDALERALEENDD